MTAKLQTFKVALSMLSPVFIGGGEQATLSPYTDFIQQGNQVIIIDQHKLQNALGIKTDLIEEFVQGIRCGFDNNLANLDGGQFNQLQLFGLFCMSNPKPFILNAKRRTLLLNVERAEKCGIVTHGSAGLSGFKKLVFSEAKG